MFCLVWFDTAKRKLKIREESEVLVFTKKDGTEVEKDTLGEGIKTVLVKKCYLGPPGVIHFWMQAPSKNRFKPGGVPGVDPWPSY